MTKKIDYLTEYVNKELDILRIKDQTLRSNIDNLLGSVYDFFQGEPNHMKFFLNGLISCIDRKPMSPITIQDFESNEIQRSNKRDTYNWYTCVRYPQVYMDENGILWDTKAIAFRFLDSDLREKIYLYNNEYNSKKQITLPYYPNQEIITIPKSKQEYMELGL